MNALQNIDPAWAWEEYTQPLDRADAAHLFRRAGFGATSEQLDRATGQSAREVLAAIENGPARQDWDAEVRQLERAALAGSNADSLAATWIYRMLVTSSQLTEKMTLFWHGHFATSAEKVDNVRLMHDQNQLLRDFALGDFGELLQRISKDPAMLVYLDSATNRKAHPNENYAREIMELFCLGEGQYTEADIRELARCFTGWEIRRDRFRFNRYQNDRGEKTIFGETGKFSGEQAVELVVQRNSAPGFLVGKLARYFLFDEPVPPTSLLEPLARRLRREQMQIGPVVRQMLTSNLMFSEHARARKVRSPVELAVGFLRTLEGSTNTVQLAERLKRIGQGLLYPPNVKGWDGGRAWINSSTLLGRSNLIRGLLDSDKTRFGRKSIVDYFQSRELKQPDEIIGWLQKQLFAVPLPDASRGAVESLMTAENRSSEQRLQDGVHALCTLPEFQLA